MSEYSRRHGAYGEPMQSADSDRPAEANRFSRRNARYADRPATHPPTHPSGDQAGHQGNYPAEDGSWFDGTDPDDGDAQAMRPASNDFSRSRSRQSDSGYSYAGAGSSSRSRKKPGFSFSSTKSGSRFASAGADGSGGGYDDNGNGGQHGYVGYSVNDMRRKSSPLRTAIVAVVALVVVGVLAFAAYQALSSIGLFGSSTADSQEVEVFIPEGSATSEIARFLKDKNVIAKESSFINAVQQRGVESQLQPGKYTLRTHMTDSEAIDALIAGPNGGGGGGNKLTIPEGLTLEATAAKVEAACGIPAADFIAEAHMADKYAGEFPFLAGVYNNSLEGFLYPKTYQVPVDATAEDVVRILLKQFAIEIDGLDLAYAEGKNLNIYDIVVIASMIEKETAQLDERPLVSSVIYNRLHEGMKLQICATVVYAIGMENYDGHPLLNSDLEIDSPYNTYLVSSLPVGPICSPHISSIEAAAHPAETDYFYYVLTSEDGRHTFCRNEDEFAEANNAYHELFGVPN